MVAVEALAPVAPIACLHAIGAFEEGASLPRSLMPVTIGQFAEILKTAASGSPFLASFSAGKYAKEMGEAPPGFEPGMADLQSSVAPTQPATKSQLPETDTERLARCLALLTQKSPDLALLVESWDNLPEAVRAGIVAMVKASLSR